MRRAKINELRGLSPARRQPLRGNESAETMRGRQQSIIGNAIDAKIYNR